MENLPLFTGFYLSQVLVWDVFHQQYVFRMPGFQPSWEVSQAIAPGCYSPNIFAWDLCRVGVEVRWDQLRDLCIVDFVSLDFRKNLLSTRWAVGRAGTTSLDSRGITPLLPIYMAIITGATLR